jgi:hypothetical protein
MGVTCGGLQLGSAPTVSGSLPAQPPGMSKPSPSTVAHVLVRVVQSPVLLELMSSMIEEVALVELVSTDTSKLPLESSISLKVSKAQSC